MKKLELGQVVITRGADEVLTEIDILTALEKYSAYDWGNVCREDWDANDEALENDMRILASYESKNGEKFWIITEWDRSVTTILLPEEY